MAENKTEEEILETDTVNEEASSNKETQNYLTPSC